MSEMLEKARKYEFIQGQQIKEEERPAFHITPYVGWMNDPNGFSYYKGEYHLFYQYNPYSTHWDSMHWGHVVSKDLLHWNYVPTALAPDEDYDKFGCFSGSAIELEDGRQLLMYTSVNQEKLEDGTVRDIQTQAVAVGDGKDYEKYDKNPVLTAKDLPKGASKVDFRDPKIWKGNDGNFYCVIGSRPADGSGQILLYRSKNGFEWEFVSTLAENKNRYGKMWECPDFFALDEKYFLICSPQNMKAQKYEFHNGNNSVYFAGKYNETEHTFQKEAPKSLDYGLDFYAPQTTKLPDGRRILIAWMKSWDACVIPDGQKWQGMMTLPRELRYMNGRLYQNPVEELKQYRKNPCCLKDQEISGTVQFDEVRGRMLDLTVEIENGQFDEFCLELAHNMEYTTTYTYNRKKQIMEVDRTCCGVTKDVICRRIWKVTEGKETLKLRFILDRQSIELFVNDGEQVVTTAICTPIEADEIVFSCDGKAKVNVEKYEIVV